MKIIQRQPHRLKELLCVLFGHEWNNYGICKCLKHGYAYDEYNKCARCGLENHGIKYCIHCFTEFAMNNTHVKYTECSENLHNFHQHIYGTLAKGYAFSGTHPHPLKST